MEFSALLWALYTFCFRVSSALYSVRSACSRFIRACLTVYCDCHPLNMGTLRLRNTSSRTLFLNCVLKGIVAVSGRYCGVYTGLYLIIPPDSVSAVKLPLG